MREQTWMKRFIALSSDQHLYIYRSERVRRLSASLEVFVVAAWSVPADFTTPILAVPTGPMGRAGHQPDRHDRPVDLPERARGAAVVDRPAIRAVHPGQGRAVRRCVAANAGVRAVRFG